MSQQPQRHRAEALIDFATALFERAGCERGKAALVGELLVEADLMGHTTHGLHLASAYLEEIQSGAMLGKGEPEVIGDVGAAVTWNGRRLPGVWLTARAVDLAAERAGSHGLGTVAIRNSHHIACLAVYLERATRHGKMVIIASSDPSDASVAPFGGRKAVFTPDPIAVGIPTSDGPILIDTSSSITTNGMTARLRKEGRRFPGPWALTADGVATDDPNALFTEPGGTLLPTGGTDHGHKGYALALMVEALTQGLSGFGRAEKPTGWGANVFVQVMDPALYGGADAFCRQTDFVAAECRGNPPAAGHSAVRMPGDAALQRKRQALRDGVALYPGVMTALGDWARRLDVAVPQSIEDSP